VDMYYGVRTVRNKAVQDKLTWHQDSIWLYQWIVIICNIKKYKDCDKFFVVREGLCGGEL
jgi:hypothetical protein